MNKYTVQMISNICKLTPHTLRAWEKRYQVVAPERSSGGQRLYSEQDLERLQYLQRLVKRGHKISQIAKLPNEELIKLLKDQQLESLKTDPLQHQRIEGLLGSLKSYDLKSLMQQLEALKLDFSIRGYLFSIILPLFEKVGHMVENKDLNISQEHALSAIVRSSLLQINPPLLHHLPNKVIALATPEGNLHELGIIMANILCRANQWETIYFGPNLPADSLGESLKALETPYLLLGGLYPGNTDLFQKYLEELQKYYSGKVLLGGQDGGLDLSKFTNMTVIIQKDFDSLDHALKHYN